MSYVFSTEKVGSVKLQNFHHSNGTNFVLAGIDGQTNDANTVINSFLQETNILIGDKNNATFGRIKKVTRRNSTTTYLDIEDDE